MGWVGEFARVGSATQASSVNVPMLAPTAVGQTLVLAANAPSVSAETAFSVTDPKGNVWTQRVVKGAAAPINSQVVILTCPVTTAHTTSDTLVLHASVRSPACWCVLGQAFDDPTGFDTAASATGASTAPASGNTATAAQDSELIVGAFGFIDTGPGAEVFTPQAGFTAATKVNAALGTPKSLTVAWAYVNAPGARSASGGLSASAQWVADVIALKTPTPAAPTPYYWFNAAGEKVPMTLSAL